MISKKDNYTPHEKDESILPKSMKLSSWQRYIRLVKQKKTGHPVLLVNFKHQVLASSGLRPGVLLNILQCAGQFPSPPVKNHLAQDVNSIKVEKT